MRKTITEWPATSVSTVGAAASMAITDFRTVSPSTICPAILPSWYERQPGNGKCSGILRLFFQRTAQDRFQDRSQPKEKYVAQTLLSVPAFIHHDSHRAGRDPFSRRFCADEYGSHGSGKA